MIYGTTPPEQLWPDTPADRVALWHRERRMIESLRATKRSRRGSAIELSCACAKSHLLLSAIALPDDDVAVWLHGGGWLNDSSLQSPTAASGEAMKQKVALPPNYTVPDSLDIISLADLRSGRGFRGNVVARCAPPYTIMADDCVKIAAAVDRWKGGNRNTPIRASFLPA